MLAGKVGRLSGTAHMPPSRHSLLAALPLLVARAALLAELGHPLGHLARGFTGHNSL